MGQHVVHFEIIGREPEKLRGFYRELFGWEFDTSGPVSPSVSEAGQYGFVAQPDAGDGHGIPGGVGGGPTHEPHVILYVGVPDVEVALRRAEALGGARRLGPERSPGTDLIIGHFTDPEGNLVGVAGTGG